MNTINALDHKLTHFINAHHSPFWDDIMLFISAKHSWYPCYAIIIAYLIWKYKKQSWQVIIAIALLITLSDRISSGIIKPLTERLRPCHEAIFNTSLNLPDGCGGAYGFVSSHASNSFAIAMFLFLLLGGKVKRWGWMAWACTVSYSRIYLGAHFVGDVLAGAILGIVLALLIHQLLERFQYSFPKITPNKY